MYDIYKSIQDRMRKFLTAETTLSSDASIGDTFVNVTDATNFGFEGLNDNVPNIIFMDDNTSGKKIQGGLEGTEPVIVSSVDTDTNIVTFESPLTRAWTTTDGAYIQRFPGETVVNRVIIGDLQVNTKYPLICVVPTNETMDWFTMPGGTRETFTIDFMIYVSDGDTESATEELLKLTKVVKWILMSNLHIQVRGADSIYGVTSKAIVSNVDYGVIQKGSEFLKAAKLTWTGEVYMLRDYLAQNDNALYTGD